VSDTGFPNGNTIAYRLAEAERDIRRIEEENLSRYNELRKSLVTETHDLARKVDRLMWAIVTACITITVAMVVYVATLPPT
jgi:hypothetical protein